MKITCHSCGAKYTVSDEKVQGKTVKMKCRKCSSTIVVGASAQADGSHGGEDATALHQTDAAGESPPPGSFLVSVSDNDQRTMTLAEVVEAYNAGVITAETYVFADGMSDWQGLAENEQIVAALNEAAQATASMAGTNGSHAVSTPSPAPAAAAYAAPAATPAATESKPAAARRENRKSADLFGGGGGLATESSSSTFGGGALAASSSVGTSTGKREENSVLFSLNALTSAAPAPAPRASVTTATKEDSGLIDLKALSANAPAAAAPTQAAAPVVDAIGLFPLGAPVAPPPPPPSAATYAAPPAPPQSNLVRNLGLAIGGVIAICAVIAVFLLAKGGNDPKPAETAQAQTPTAPTATALSTTPTTTTTVTSTPTDTPVGDASESGSASAKPRATGGPRPTGKPTGTATSTGGKPTATATPTAKPLPCGCKPGDVDCAIKCSMKKK